LKNVKSVEWDKNEHLLTHLCPRYCWDWADCTALSRI